MASMVFQHSDKNAFVQCFGPFEFHSSCYQYMTKLGHRNVWCLCRFWYLECWLHCNWVAHMCPTILRSPAYACTVPHCSGRLHTAVLYLLTCLQATLYSAIWEYYLFCIGCASTDTRGSFSWDYWFSPAMFPKGTLLFYMLFESSSNIL